MPENNLGARMIEQSPNKVAEEELLRMTAEVVAAYVRNNTLPTAQLAEVINAVYLSLRGLENKGVEGKAEALKPAVPIRKSITPDYLVCLEDGKKLKMLKRHLRSTYGMTPDEYRQKWGLPPDYPMVAPNYAEQRSAFAKKIGLGRGTGRQAGKRAGTAKKVFIHVASRVVSLGALTGTALTHSRQHYHCNTDARQAARQHSITICSVS